MKKDENAIYGVMMWPCYATIESFKRGMETAKHAVTTDFYKSYSDHKAAMQIIAACAKIYILENYQKITDWSTLNVIIDDNSKMQTEYYNYDTTNSISKRIKAMRGIESALDNMNKKRHNPVVLFTDVVIDPTDGDFSVTINDKDHLLLHDDSVIIIADYIEKQLKNQQ